MLFVALADGEVTESEWVTILELVDETSQRLNVRLAEVERYDIVASLLTPEGPPFSINDAAVAVAQDKYCRENIARWIRAVTYADGVGSEAENRAIATITNSLRSAMRATDEADHQQ